MCTLECECVWLYVCVYICLCIGAGATCWPFLESLSFHFFSLSCACDSQHAPHHRTHHTLTHTHSAAAIHTHTLILSPSLFSPHSLAFNTFKSLSVFPDNLQWLPHSPLSFSPWTNLFNVNSFLATLLYWLVAFLQVTRGEYNHNIYQFKYVTS